MNCLRRCSTIQLWWLVWALLPLFAHFDASFLQLRWCFALPSAVSLAVSLCQHSCVGWVRPHLTKGSCCRCQLKPVTSAGGWGLLHLWIWPSLLVMDAPGHKLKPRCSIAECWAPFSALDDSRSWISQAGQRKGIVLVVRLRMARGVVTWSSAMIFCEDFLVGGTWLWLLTVLPSSPLHQWTVKSQQTQSPQAIASKTNELLLWVLWAISWLQNFVAASSLRGLRPLWAWTHSDPHCNISGATCVHNTWICTNALPHCFPNVLGILLFGIWYWRAQRYVPHSADCREDTPPYEMLFGAKNVRKLVNPTVLKILCDAAGVSPAEFCSLPDTAKCAIQSKLLKHFTSYLGVFELERMHPEQAVKVLHMGPSVQTHSQWRKLKHRIW